MRTIAPEAIAAASGAVYRKAIGEAFATAHRTLRDELANPEVTTVFVMVGPPGSGKSTWLASQPDLAHIVAWDSVNSTRGQRAGMAKRITDAGRRAVAVVALCPFGICLDRNAERDGDRRVPETYVREAYANLQLWPVAADEGWTDVWHIDTSGVRLDRRTTEDADRKAGRTFYRWRTEEDDRVRPEHRARHGRLFSWLYPPDGGHPGDDWGCRCWAETVKDDDVVETVDGDLRARPLTVPRWARRR